MSAAVMHRVLKLPPQDGEVSKKKTHADQSNSTTSGKLDAEERKLSVGLRASNNRDYTADY